MGVRPYRRQVVLEFDSKFMVFQHALVCQQLDHVPQDAPRVHHTDLVGNIARGVAPEGGIGLAMVGTLEDSATYVAVYGPGGLLHTERGRTFQDSDYVRRWVVTQGLDWVRRAALRQLDSPADWSH